MMMILKKDLSVLLAEARFFISQEQK